MSFQKLKNSSFAIGAMMLLFCTSATFANPLGISLSLSVHPSRKQFITDLNNLIAKASFSVIGTVIQKNDLIDRNENPPNPYNIALKYCMKDLLSFLLEQNQQGKLIHVVLEHRGKKEDQDLKQEFQNVASSIDQMGFEPKFAMKPTNSTGLQFADLTARPMAQRVLRPQQRNRPFKAIEDKLVSLRRIPAKPE